MKNIEIHKMPSGYIYGCWALGRPMAKHWGSGGLWERIKRNFGSPDVAFGKTDGIPDYVIYYDKTNGHDWLDLKHIGDDTFEFGYWDPPYDRMYKPEGQEIWRICKKLAILHIMVYPTSWFKDARRMGGIAITMGPLKQIRFLQIFEKEQCGKKLF
jgi:hypothetical protein